MAGATRQPRTGDPSELPVGIQKSGSSVNVVRREWGETAALPVFRYRAAERAAKAVKTLAVDLASLADLDATDLRHRWHDAFGIEPLARLSREVMIAALSYHIQAEAEGGLSKKAERRLEKLSLELGTNGTLSVEVDDGIRLGTRLVREWNGTVHEVIVLETGYLWKGKTYASLSEIARLITGARWSGPRFFGTAAKVRSRPPSGSGTALDRRPSRVVVASAAAQP